jgi:hypothetical protein
MSFALPFPAMRLASKTAEKRFPPAHLQGKSCVIYSNFLGAELLNTGSGDIV